MSMRLSFQGFPERCKGTRRLALLTPWSLATLSSWEGKAGHQPSGQHLRRHRWVAILRHRDLEEPCPNLRSLSGSSLAGLVQVEPPGDRCRGRLSAKGVGG